jgi:hypothetical protein
MLVLLLIWKQESNLTMSVLRGGLPGVGPWVLVYSEVYYTKALAIAREKELKSGHSGGVKRFTEYS